MQWVIYAKGLNEGTLIGPFESRAVAIEFAETLFNESNALDYKVFQMKLPPELAKQVAATPKGLFITSAPANWPTS